MNDRLFDGGNDKPTSIQLTAGNAVTRTRDTGKLIANERSVIVRWL